MANPNIPTRVILGDTLLTKSINNETDILFTSKDFQLLRIGVLLRIRKKEIYLFMIKGRI